MTLLSVSLLLGDRPHIRAPRTVEKIIRRDGRDSRHEYALTLRLEPESNDRGLIDDTRRRRSLTPGSSMDYCIYSRDTCFFILYIYLFPARLLRRALWRYNNSPWPGSEAHHFSARPSLHPPIILIFFSLAHWPASKAGYMGKFPGLPLCS